MALLGFKKEKWKHNNPEVRIAGLDEFGENDLAITLSLMLEDEVLEVRLAALAKINDPWLLDSVQEKIKDSVVLTALQERMNALLVQEILHTEDVEKLQDAMEKVSNAESLAEVAVKARLPEVRRQAVDRIDNQLILVEILRQNCGKATALTALDKINNIDMLQQVVEKSTSRAARRQAAEKLAQIRREPTPEEIRSRELQKLVDTAVELSEMWNVDGTVDRFDDLAKAWQKLDSQKRHPLKMQFDFARNSFLANRAEFKKFQEEKEAQSGEVNTLLARNDAICITVEEMIGSKANDVDAEFQKLVHEWDENRQNLHQLMKAEMIDKLLPLTRFEENCRRVRKLTKHIGREREVYMELRAECDRIDKMLVGKNPQKARKPLKKLQSQLSAAQWNFFSREEIEQSIARLEQNMNDQIATKRCQHEVARQTLRKEHENLCLRLEVLAECEDFAGVDEEIDRLLKEQKNLSGTGDGAFTDLALRFKQGLENVKKARNTFFEQKDWQRWANKTRKQELVAQVEALDEVLDLSKVVESVRTAREEWKKIGAAPKKEEVSLWNRFNAACTRNYKRCAPYFEELEQRKLHILQRKEELCLEAERHSDSEDWKKISTKLQKMQRQWNELGFANKGGEKKLTERFRAATAVFFTRRQENLSQMAEERQGNLTVKIKLCEDAEILAREPQAQNIKEIIKLQRQWKKIGPVPRGQEDAIWKRFRQASDQFFGKLDDEKKENLMHKEDLCRQFENLVKDLQGTINWNEVNQVVVNLQEQWETIGSVPDEQNNRLEKCFADIHAMFDKARTKEKQLMVEQLMQNSEKKSVILEKAEKLLSSGVPEEHADKILKLQEEWQLIGRAARNDEQLLEYEFRSICDAVLEGQTEKYSKMIQEQEAILKKKEILCFRLEKIIGIERPEKTNAVTNKTLTLAEELKLAFEANFVLAGKGDDSSRKKTEVESIQKEWKTIGPLRFKDEKALAGRFERALESFRQSETQSPEKRGRKRQ